MYLKSHASTLSMSEVEIWIREDPEEVLQTPYVNGKGAAYLLPLDDNTSVYEFNKVWVTYKAPPIICSKQQFQILMLFRK